MPATSDLFGKIVSTPTSTRWSHTYCAGSLFAVLSLTGPAESEISHHGKDIINNLEAEFFTLEEKTLVGIKEAIVQSITDLPKEIALSFCVAFIKETILYIFVVGGGSILLKRGETQGTLITKTAKEDDPIESRTVSSLSGFLQDHDIIVLETQACQTILSPEKIKTALIAEDVVHAAEQVSPLVADKDDGASAALFILHKAPPKTAVEGIHPETKNESPSHGGEKERPLPSHHEEIIVHPTPSHPRESVLQLLRQRLPKSLPLPSLHLSHGKKVIVSIAVILLCVFAGSILLTVRNKESVKQQALFKEVRDTAQKQYDEGVSLQSLNKSLAQEDFLKAKKTLEDKKSTFKPGTKEEKELTALLAKVNDALGGSETTQQASLQKADDADALLKLARTEHPNALTRDDKTIFYVTSDGVFKVLSGDKAERIIKNDDDWSDAVGIGTFSGNIYILDRKQGLLKFVNTSDGYTKTTYFKGDTPDLKDAASMSIDGSVWILLKNGTVLKYTKGSKDAFSLTGAPSSLAGPTRIVTDSDTEHLYILDPKGKRIVRFAKNGSYDTSYSNDTFQEAKELDVNETEKKLFVLSGDTIYQLGL